jgi:hypothetical protein
VPPATDGVGAVSHLERVILSDSLIIFQLAVCRHFFFLLHRLFITMGQDVEETVVMAITEADITIAMGNGSTTIDTEKNTIIILIIGNGSITSGMLGNTIRSIMTIGK